MSTEVWQIDHSGERWRIGVRRNWDGTLLRWATTDEVAQVFGRDFTPTRRFTKRQAYLRFEVTPFRLRRDIKWRG